MKDGHDRELGMDRPITRRDFMNGVAVGVGGAVAGSWLAGCGGAKTRPLGQDAAGYNPASATGMRGSHAGSFETGHRVRDGTFWQQAGAVSVSPECYEKLMTVSPATIDRLLIRGQPVRGKRRGFTKPGTLLKDRIPIRTWADWDEDRPGFSEIDLVDHSGGLVIRGQDHAWTLCFTDICTTWTESIAVRNKAQVHVFAAIQQARQRLPFPLLGIDSDNGSEFINDQLYRYCLREEITFTRGRAGRKNDNAYVEQKNWSVVRRAVGYYRYDTPEQLDLLNSLYALLHFYGNFFLPTMKLKEKVRLGSKVKRIYDDPQTPYARTLASDLVSEADKAQLREVYSHLDLFALRQRIDELQDQLLATVSQ